MSFKLLLCFLFFATLFSINVRPQSFGFGCLGFVGGYGGYSYQKYQATGLNNYIAEFNQIRSDSLTNPMSNFGSAKGYRVGLNFFRANLEGLILTAKGFYQLLQENHSSNSIVSSGESNTTYELDMKTWGVGIDLGTSITDAVSWKVVDAAILFNTAEFKTTLNLPGAITEVANYKSDAAALGYSVGTGFILNIIDEYITLEGLAAFTVITFDELQKDDGTKLPVNENSSQPMQNFIEAGGFNAVIQLNIGFPL